MREHAHRENRRARRERHRRSTARGAAGAALLALAAAWSFLPAFALAAQDLQVADSQGTTEVLVPEIGWRRAVLGRRLPEQSVVTSWLDSAMTAEGEGLLFRLAPLTHVRLLSVTEDLIVLSLQSGRIMVESERAIAVDLPGPGLRIAVPQAARFHLSTLDLTVQDGTVEVSAPGGPPATVEAGRSVSLVPHDLRPIF